MKASARRFRSALAVLVLLAAGPAPAGVGGVEPPGCVGTLVTLAATDTPLDIPDGPGGTVSSTITVSGLDSYIDNAGVLTLVLHELVADLDIDVTSPAGTTVTLTTDNGGTNSNTFDGTFWDDGVGFLNPPGPVSDNPLIGTQLILVPEEAMGAFIGEDPNGTWTITVTDDTAQNTGSLFGWALDLTTLPAPPIFAAPVSVTSTDTPLPITDLATTTSTIAFAGAGAFVCDVDLTTDITHTSADDLEVHVTSPGGTVSTLTTDNGGGNDNVFAGTLWDDDGGDSNPPGPATDNVYANLVVETPLVPEEAMGAFIGENPNGTWTISVADDAGGNVGTLNSWTVEVTTCSCVGGGGANPLEIPTLGRPGLLVLLLAITLGALVILRRRG
jgi:subtilisin-like proprotein convertase family protein